MTSPSQVYLSGLPLSTWQDALQIAEGADLQSEADDSSDPLSRSRDSSYPTHGADEKITENISLEQLFGHAPGLQVECRRYKYLPIISADTDINRYRY